VEWTDIIPWLALIGSWFTIAFGVWKFVDGKLVSIRRDITANERAIAEHKLYTALHYVTKQGMTEQMMSLTKAVGDVGVRIDGLNTRLDRVIEANNKPHRMS